MTCLDFMQTLLTFTSKSLNLIPFLLYNSNFFKHKTQNNICGRSIFHIMYILLSTYIFIPGNKQKKPLNSIINNKMAYSTFIDECENELAYGILTYND